MSFAAGPAAGLAQGLDRDQSGIAALTPGHTQTPVRTVHIQTRSHARVNVPGKKRQSHARPLVSSLGNLSDWGGDSRCHGYAGLSQPLNKHWGQMWRNTKNPVRNRTRKKSDNKDKHVLRRTVIALCAKFRISDSQAVYHVTRPMPQGRFLLPLTFSSALPFFSFSLSL